MRVRLGSARVVSGMQNRDALNVMMPADLIAAKGDWRCMGAFMCL
jgi:hypothetical protein